MGSFAAVVLMFAHIYVVQCGTVARNGLCTQTSECLSDKGLSCVHTWTTCANGQCDCSDEEVWFDGRCQPKLYLGSDCDAANIASVDVTSVSCVGGKVTCDSGYREVERRCLKGTKGLGEECSSSFECYITRSDCRTKNSSIPKACVCESNYKNVDNNCKKANLDEACSEVEDCVSDTMICGPSNTCTCKSTLQKYEGACIETGTVNLNETCGTGDSICVLGLTCASCPGETDRRCQEAPTPIDVTTPSGAELCVPVAVNLLLAVGLAIFGKETLM